jgi:hypothetical protein
MFRGTAKGVVFLDDEMSDQLRQCTWQPPHALLIPNQHMMEQEIFTDASSGGNGCACCCGLFRRSRVVSRTNLHLLCKVQSHSDPERGIASLYQQGHCCLFLWVLLRCGTCSAVSPGEPGADAGTHCALHICFQKSAISKHFRDFRPVSFSLS